MAWIRCRWPDLLGLGKSIWSSTAWTGSPGRAKSVGCRATGTVPTGLTGTCRIGATVKMLTSTKASEGGNAGNAVCSNRVSPIRMLGCSRSSGTHRQWLNSWRERCASGWYARSAAGSSSDMAWLGRLAGSSPSSVPGRLSPKANPGAAIGVIDQSSTVVRSIRRTACTAIRIVMGSWLDPLTQRRSPATGSSGLVGCGLNRPPRARQRTRCALVGWGRGRARRRCRCSRTAAPGLPRRPTRSAASMPPP